jgi:malonyl-CoA/methylmalonyl-CoA synthetase
MTENLYDLFRQRFPTDRAEPFIETMDGVLYSYGDLEAISGRFARTLADLGVRAGDRVAIQVDKSPEAIFLYLACLRAGAIYLPLNTAYKQAEVAYFLSDARPRIMICHPEAEETVADTARDCGVSRLLTLDQAGGGSFAELAGTRDAEFPTADAAPDDVAAIIYTSGTTGKSKGVMLTHLNMGSNALTLHRAWGWVPGDVLLHALPIFHAHGMFIATNCALLNGSKMLFMAKFDAATAIGLLPRATVFMGVPTFYTRLLANPALDVEACRAMRLFISGSAPLLEETFHAFRERTGHTILERYGMTETVMNTSNPLNGERIPGTVGPPLPGIEARVAGEDGEILPTGEVGVLEVRGPNVFKGYWGMPEKTQSEFREDGFFITGDLARIDTNGYVSIVGRAKDMIISGGYNVYPKEVETLIDDMDGVLESAVIGVPHPDFGEAVTAAVIRRPGHAAPPAADEIIRRLRGEIANYKVPKAVFFVDNLPRNAIGKIQKGHLRDRFVDTFADDARIR